ncbi:MAG: DUF3298 domain-containing protein [Pseudodesulfovibrio sp.]|uniref:DUF3298 and DUF4163 domain-containing protein n=1 Tax=Pseudodesulfovibrio sp. TaxID=2035812 RepID=UPI003D1120FC
MRIWLPIVLGLLLFSAAARAEAPCTPLVLTAVTISEETTGFSIDAEYPVLCRTEANPVIRDFVSNTVFDLKKLDPAHDMQFFPHKYELITRYAVWPSPGARFVSVKLHVMVYSGGAHPNNWPMTWVFDMTDGSQVPLDRLFTDPEKALPAVSAACRKALIPALGQMYLKDMLDPGLEPIEDNFERFALTVEGVAFFFAPYQVAPYAAGEQVVTIPYADLAPLFSPDVARALGL